MVSTLLQSLVSEKSSLQISPVPLVVAVAVVCALSVSVSDQARGQSEPLLPNLVEEIKQKQLDLRSLTATFVQEKVSELFLEPEVSSGSFAYVAPGQVRWEYLEPTEIVVVVNENIMLTWYRDLGRAERLNVGRQADRVLQFLNTANSLATLQRYFTLQIGIPKDAEAPYRFMLEPRFKRVAKRITSMTIHLDRNLYVPVLLRYEEPTGDITEYRFEDIVVNEEVSSTLFELELPDDVEERVIQLGESSDR